ncbi:MAG: hypothetical protein PUH34_10635 [Eubacteriales bacterium]|nr:hypothetical protein [Eubacteriales bacterium]
MRIHMDEEKRIAEIWLTKAESDDPAVEARLKPFYKECKDHKYLAVVYRSGRESLLETTKDLLRHNRNLDVHPRKPRTRSLDMGR